MKWPVKIGSGMDRSLTDLSSCKAFGQPTTDHRPSMHVFGF